MKENNSEHDMISDIEFARKHSFVNEEEKLTPDIYPELTTFPVREFYQLLPIPDNKPTLPEYVFIEGPDRSRPRPEESVLYELFVSSWNMTWEAGTERRGFLWNEAPTDLAWLLDTEANIRLVYGNPKGNYDAYAPLYHLLPKATLEKFGLPALKRGIWPMPRTRHLLRNILPSAFDTRLSDALSYHLWSHLNPRGVPSQYSTDDPIRIVSHNLNFWMPYIDLVAQERALELGRTEMDEEPQRLAYEEHKSAMPPGVKLETPLYGGPLWTGEEEAYEATAKMVEAADREGNLRAIFDAVRSNRIEDDFSSRWSFEREDFERNLYSKRNKIKVTFVELDETVPVHGPDSEIHEDLLWEDFMTILNEKERRIVVCLRNGITRLGDIAESFGYATHSPISKKLTKIRSKAKRFLDH